MNYASVFLVFILLCSLVFWYISGKKYYTGPIVEAQTGGYNSDENSPRPAEMETKAEKEI